MDSLRTEIESELKRSRLDKTRLYSILLKLIDNCGGTGGGGGVGPQGPRVLQDLGVPRVPRVPRVNLKVLPSLLPNLSPNLPPNLPPSPPPKRLLLRKPHPRKYI